MFPALVLSATPPAWIVIPTSRAPSPPAPTAASTRTTSNLLRSPAANPATGPPANTSASAAVAADSTPTRALSFFLYPHIPPLLKSPPPPKHHQVIAGQMNCVNCHDPHGHDIMK